MYYEGANNGTFFITFLLGITMKIDDGQPTRPNQRNKGKGKGKKSK